MWLEHSFADGRFEAQFRLCVKGKAFDTFQTGRWVLAGDLETVNIQTVDGKPFVRQDQYKILKHDAKTQSYRYLANGFVFSSRRVDAKFQLPDCEAIS